MIYYLVSKDDFATLYRFGYVVVKSGASAESDNPREAIQRIFSSSDIFEYAQERLIIECEKGSSERIEMSNVINLYPLDEVSKGIYESQFNRNIIFKEPIFKDIAERFIKHDVMKQITLSGINALRSIFGLKEEQNSDLINDIILGKTFLREWKYFNVPLEKRTPYSMLIAYNRYQHYPKDVRGFFYDAADCFMYGSMYARLPQPNDFLGYDNEIISTSCKSYFNILDSIPKESKFTSVVEIIERENPKISSHIESVYGSIRAMALYFYMKDMIVTEGELSMPILRTLYKIKEVYSNEFSTLLTLLGGFLGYTWIYDRLYEFTDSQILSRRYTLDDIFPKKEIKNEQYQSGPSPVTIDKSIKTPTSHQEVSSNEEAKIVTSLNEIEAVESAQRNDENLQDQDIIIDVTYIAKLVFTKRSPRRNSFVEKLQESKDILLKLIKEKNEQELTELYPKLDIQYKVKEKEKLEKFIAACLNFNNIQYGILIQSEDVNS